MSPDRATYALVQLSKTNNPVAISQGEVEKKMIAPLGSIKKEFIEDTAGKILTMYLNLIKEGGMIPSIDDIYNRVNYYNESVLFDHCLFEVLKENDDNAELDYIEELAYEMADELYLTEYQSEWDYNSSFIGDGGLAGSIANVLCTLGHSFAIDMDTVNSGQIDDISKGIESDNLREFVELICYKREGRIIVNPGQNILFPEFLEKGFTAAGFNSGFFYRGGGEN